MTLMVTAAACDVVSTQFRFISFCFLSTPANCTRQYANMQLEHENVEMVFRTCGKFIREDHQKPKS